MSGRYLTEMGDWFRAAGLKVVEYDGWQTRARSSGGYADGRPWGVMWHHTASNTSPQNDANYMCHGSSDRPIANLLIARDGAVWVLAAGATNTNGKGGPWSWSRGTVPKDSMNTYAVGVEIASNGVGEPFPVEQIDAAFLASVTLCERLGLASSDVCTHQQYAPDRKVDPATASAVQGGWQPRSCSSSGTWNLDDLIAEHQRRSGGEDDDMPSAQEVARAVWNDPMITSEVDGQDYPPYVYMHSIHGMEYKAPVTLWDHGITSEVDGQMYPVSVFIHSIHGMVADIQKRLAALEADR